MYCAECGEELRNNMNFCNKCGTEVNSRKNRKNNRECSVCGSSIEDGFYICLTRTPETRICMACDKELDTLTDKKENEQNRFIAYNYFKNFMEQIKNDETKVYLNIKLNEYEQDNKEKDQEEPENADAYANGYAIKFIKTNFLLFLISFFYSFTLSYCLVSAKLTSLLWFIIIVQTILVMFLLSKTGETFMRTTVYNARELLEDEKNYLMPLFEEVYQEAIKHNPHINRNIRLYIIDDLEIQAYVLGSNTIMITCGAINSLNREEIKGILAHEFGHISNHFPKILIIVQTSMWIVSAFLAVYKLLSRIIKHMIKVREEQYGTITVNLIGFLLDSLFVIPIFIFQFIFSMGRRSNEFYADEFAEEIGYGEELTSALKLLNKIELTGKLSFKERLLNSHPPTPERIARLERDFL
jgi:heat shock protein HtpX